MADAPLTLTAPQYSGQTLYLRMDDSPYVTVEAAPLDGADAGSFQVTAAQLHTAGLTAGTHSGKWRVGDADSPLSTDALAGIEPAFEYDGTHFVTNASSTASVLAAIAAIPTSGVVNLSFENVTLRTNQ